MSRMADWFSCSTQFCRLNSLSVSIILASTLNVHGLEPVRAERNGAISSSATQFPVPPSGKVKADAGSVEVRFTDNSLLKLVIRETKIDLMTPHGKLQIPIEDIHSIDVAMRIPEETIRAIDSAINNLGNANYRVRQSAAEFLLGQRERAYRALQKATQSLDTQVATTAEELITKIKATVPAEVLEPRLYDIVTTEHSRIAGKVEQNTFKIHTAQFGEVQMKLSDVRSIRSMFHDTVPLDDATVEAAPSNLGNHQGNIGKTYKWRVTGVNQGHIWGTDLYTTDTTLGLAAVHAGLLKVGQTGVIKVTIVPSPPMFIGSTRNGISSSAYGAYPAAFRLDR